MQESGGRMYCTTAGNSFKLFMLYRKIHANEAGAAIPNSYLFVVLNFCLQRVFNIRKHFRHDPSAEVAWLLLRSLGIFISLLKNVKA